MKLLLLGIGKTKPDFIEEGLKEYTRRIERYYPFLTEFHPGNKKARSLSGELVRQKESEIIEKHFLPGDLVILLDEKGKSMSSVEFAKKMESWLTMGHKRIVFVVGGAMGHDPALKARADRILSLSAMTYSHQLIRLVFAEQLYRAATIIHNHPYHNE